jgi:hypothetical protein
MRVICDHISENTKCDNDVRSRLRRYNVKMRSSDEREPREITNAIDEPRMMLETIRETRGDDKHYLYCLCVVQVETV